VDVVADIQKQTELPADSFDHIVMSHVIEHLPDALGAMQELYRVAKPDCRLILRCPYGSSDDAWEDPTHVRPYFLNSFAYFAQPTYWRADYGYRGDWSAEMIQVIVRKELRTRPDVRELMHTHRNIVREMIVSLKAIKPMRENRKDLQEAAKISITFEP
jgi:SAM-dependent methyltransferase